ncbi:MAG: hypothetical protein ACLPKB_21055 [Xanthobacteraceae bacterium]
MILNQSRLQIRASAALAPCTLEGALPARGTGVLQADAEAVRHDWHPLIWRVIRHRGCLGGDVEPAGELSDNPSPGQALVGDR